MYDLLKIQTPHIHIYMSISITTRQFCFHICVCQMDVNRLYLHIIYQCPGYANSVFFSDRRKPTKAWAWDIHVSNNTTPLSRARHPRLQLSFLYKGHKLPPVGNWPSSAFLNGWIRLGIARKIEAIFIRLICFLVSSFSWWKILIIQILVRDEIR